MCAGKWPSLTQVCLQEGASPHASSGQAGTVRERHQPTALCEWQEQLCEKGGRSRCLVRGAGHGSCPGNPRLCLIWRCMGYPALMLLVQMMHNDNGPVSKNCACADHSSFIGAYLRACVWMMHCHCAGAEAVQAGQPREVGQGGRRCGRQEQAGLQVPLQGAARELQGEEILDWFL